MNFNDYCFAVTWDDNDEHAEPYVIQAESRDEAWAKLCVELSVDTWANYYDTGQTATGVSLQLTHSHSDTRHKFCHECAERLCPNPVMKDGYYYHKECVK